MPATRKSKQSKHKKPLLQHELFHNAALLEKRGNEALKKLFVTTSREVPAYKTTLRSHGVTPTSISLPKDLALLPVLTKDSYIRTHKLRDLMPKSATRSLTTFSATSGTTGAPVFIPRTDAHMEIYRAYAERFLLDQFEVRNKKTLGIIGFAMGIWIGGIFTYRTFLSIAEQGHPLALVPVGADMALILETIRTLGHDYEQIIIMGYPPFVRDLIDQGTSEGIKWSDYRLRLMFAAEGITEEFRTIIAKEAGLENPFRDIVNIYGTVEMGTMAYETPLSYLIRDHLWKHPKLYKDIFPNTRRVPTIAQYDPTRYHFEESGGNIYGSSYGTAIPLVRYSFPDRGGVYTFEQLLTLIREKTGVDMLARAKTAGVLDTVTPFPFVFLYEREGNTIVYSGANIYADEVRSIIGSKSQHARFTGRFTLEKSEMRGKQELHVHIELRSGVRGSKAMAVEAGNRIAEKLRKVNSEYAAVYQMSNGRAHPKVVLWKQGSAPHFTGKGKQRWVRKTP